MSISGTEDVRIHTKHTSLLSLFNAVWSRTKFATGMHRFKSNADRSAKHEVEYSHLSLLKPDPFLAINCKLAFQSASINLSASLNDSFGSSAHLFRHPVVHGSQHWMECSCNMGNMTWIRKQAWSWTIPSSQRHTRYLSQTMQSLTRGIIRISLALLTQIIKDAGLLVADVIMGHCLSRKYLCPIY